VSPKNVQTLKRYSSKL